MDRRIAQDLDRWLTTPPEESGDGWDEEQEMAEMEAHDTAVNNAGGVCPDPDCYHNLPAPAHDPSDDDIPF